MVFDFSDSQWFKVFLMDWHLLSKPMIAFPGKQEPWEQFLIKIFGVFGTRFWVEAIILWFGAWNGPWWFRKVFMKLESASHSGWNWDLALSKLKSLVMLRPCQYSARRRIESKNIFACHAETLTISEACA
jgi:hypothetical protein